MTTISQHQKAMDTPEVSSEAELSGQGRTKVQIERYDLDGKLKYTNTVALIHFASEMQAKFEVDMQTNTRHYYRCICGEWTLDILTPKVEGGNQP